MDIEALTLLFKNKYLELIKANKANKANLVLIFKEVLYFFLDKLETEKQNKIKPSTCGLNTLSKLWLSKNFGGKRFFKEEYGEIKRQISDNKVKTRATEYRVLTSLLYRVYREKKIQSWYSYIQSLDHNNNSIGIDKLELTGEPFLPKLEQ